MSAWILRTREMTPELKQKIYENKIFLRERHFKAELISDCKYGLFIFARNIVIARPLSILCIINTVEIFAVYILNVS
jgi:hypothetical protein